MGGLEEHLPAKVCCVILEAKLKKMHEISNTSINSRLLNPPFLAAARCGNLDSPRNGRVDLTGTTVGSTATYRCKNGFILANGDRIRECGANGQWSGTAPNCVRKLLTI